MSEFASEPVTEATESVGKKSPTLWKYFRALEPGLITGASDDDPSGIATYTQAGAQYGLAFLWTAVAFPT